MHIFYKYNGEFGSLECDFTEKNVIDAIQWDMVAKKADYNSEEFVHITRKILNQFFDDGRVDYSLKNQKSLAEKLEPHIQEEIENGEIEVNVTYKDKEHFLMHLGLDNHSYVN
ncbi:hypothetical protein SH2C18_22440 [Clostridium sediminicola]|uniref:hypothetical protein n=1 Tax=Clostridium sediminicola TaxID=3114879 RepID=UPI0031F2753C